MAVIALGKPIKSNLDGEHGAMAYIINPAKTDGGRLVSSNYELNAATSNPHRLAQPMIDDNLAAPKGIQDNSRLAYHIKMSFSPDDPVTPERVHELGVEFAQRITGGDYKFVVATHTDRHHLHNHIMICAAAQDAPHLKAELPKDIIDQWRETSDMICRREGLSVIAQPVGHAIEPVEDGTPDSASTPDRQPHANTTMPRTSDEQDNAERSRRGYSMAELYSTLKGLGVKDRIRTSVDLIASRAESFDELVDMLDINDIHVELRGSHLTYTYKPTGFKIRDSKLGPAYDLENVMARVGDSPVVPITFNRHLIAKQTRRTVTVWLPGTKRRKRITLPRTSVVTNGSTCRAFLPVDRRQPVTDRSGRFVEHVTSPGLYQWFGMPQSHVAPLTRMEHLPVEAGKSIGQRHYYAAQARQLDDLADRVNALNAAVRWRNAAGGDANEGLRLLRGKVNTAHGNLQAAVVALNDAIANGDTDAEVEARSEVETREHLAERYDRELASIERALKQTHSDEQEQAQRREQQCRNTNRRGRHL